MRTLIKNLIAACSLAIACAVASAESPVPPDQRRSVEQTFLTFPEWFLVHSPAEYARYVTAHPAHGFPFLGHIGQIWSSYASVTREQFRAHYPANGGYHVMICVIAGSTSVEYAIRSLYENTLGRVSWAASSRTLTAEDAYGAVVAQDYVDFIRKEPWYLYDFGAKLKGLWTSTPMFGPDLLRKWERRYALTTEYAIKAVYGKLIELATRAAYDPALLTTQVVSDHAPVPSAAHPEIKVLRTLEDGRALLEVPRYFDFRIAATRLAQEGVNLVDIAGNDSVILVTVIADRNWKPDVDGSRVLFEQPILTVPGRKRSAVVLPVAKLSPFLADAGRRGIDVEHVYDY
jgi:hypothetical protein